MTQGLSWSSICFSFAFAITWLARKDHTNFIVIGAIDNETVSIFEEPHRVEEGQTEHEGMFNWIDM